MHLDDIPGCKVVLVANNGQELMDKLPNALPVHIAVVDLSMPVMDGFTSIALLQEHHPEVRTLAISYDGSHEAILKALRAGARGFLDKTTGAGPLLVAVRHLLETGYYHDESVHQCLLNNTDGLTPEERRCKEVIDKLSDRELEVWLAVCNDEEPNNKKVGDKLAISDRTVETHVRNICGKLGVTSRVGMTLVAVRVGLVA